MLKIFSFLARILFLSDIKISKKSLTHQWYTLKNWQHEMDRLRFHTMALAHSVIFRGEKADGSSAGILRVPMGNG